MTLPEIVQYREAVNNVCEKLASNLTTYATMNGDFEFLKLPPKMQADAEKRIKILNILDKLDSIIENKALNLLN